MNKPIYAGFHRDSHGITTLGRVVLDAWVFGLIPEHDDCAGWDLGRMQVLMDRVEKEWDRYGNLPGNLPEPLRQRHAEVYARALREARERGWNPALGDDD